MPSPTEITAARLSRLVGILGAPARVDVRTNDEFKSNPMLILAAQQHASTGVEAWCQRYVKKPVIVVPGRRDTGPDCRRSASST